MPTRLRNGHVEGCLIQRAQVQDLEASARIMKLGDWLSAELGWPMASDVS
jgi:hypothetical protein